MQTGKRLAPVLWLVSVPLLAQNGQQQPSMQMGQPGMVMEKSPPMQLQEPKPELLPGIASRAPLKLEYFIDSGRSKQSDVATSRGYCPPLRGPGQASVACTPIPRPAMRATRFAVAPTAAGNRAASSHKPSCWAGSSAFAATSTSSRSSRIRWQPRPSCLRVHNDVTQMFYNALSAQQTVLVRGRLLGLG